MCQISVIVEREGAEEKVGEGVTALEMCAGGIVLNTFFEEPKLITNVMIKRIDFLGGKVVLVPAQDS